MRVTVINVVLLAHQDVVMGSAPLRSTARMTSAAFGNARHGIDIEYISLYGQTIQL